MFHIYLLKRHLTTRKLIIIVGLILSFILIRKDIIWADPAEEIQSDMVMVSTPNPVGSGARALGMGGAFISIADDATAASWNPACLLILKRPEIAIVGSNFSGKNHYNTSAIEAEIKDLSRDKWHLNYFGAVAQGIFFNRNMAFSLNYQHLYGFSKETSYLLNYKYINPKSGETIFNIPINSKIKTIGGLNTFSPAYAITITPKLFLGFTLNLWLNQELNNYWENLNTLNGEGEAPGGKVKIKGKLYEHYDFSGVNTHIGFLWRPNHRFSLGGVIKTPFKAKVRYKKEFLLVLESSKNSNLNNYFYNDESIDLRLKMPLSYGIGISVRPSDDFLVALDVYHTNWKGFLFCDPSGEKISPINRRTESLAEIKGTTQLRLGLEYLLVFEKYILPIRSGIFYDPEPASNQVDDFYGIGIGTGLPIYKEMFLDIAYQYRFGQKREAEAKFDQSIPSKVRQHYFYLSTIYYF